MGRLSAFADGSKGRGRTLSGSDPLDFFADLHKVRLGMGVPAFTLALPVAAALLAAWVDVHVRARPKPQEAPPQPAAPA